MPKRSNLGQAIVYYVKKHYFGDVDEVTESKELLDIDSGQPREVDVVIEGTVGGHRQLVSIEVVDHRRRVGTPWVESMISKHARMPTTNLVLVSWSGFTAPALEKVASQGGRVEALTPERVPGANVRFDGEPAGDLMMRQFQAPPEWADVTVDDRGSEGVLPRVRLDANVYAAPGHDQLAGTLRDLLTRLINRAAPRLHEDLAAKGRDDPESTHFDITHRLGGECYVHLSDEDRFVRVVELRTVGPLTIKEGPVDFEVWRLGNEMFAFTEIDMLQGPAVWVLTARDGTSTLSWRLV